MSSSSDSEKLALAEKLRAEREYLGYSQDEVAEHIKLSRSAISLIETGQRKVDALELKKFAQLYEKPISYFTGEYKPDLPENVIVLTRLASNLQEDDLAELKKFAEFLQMRKDTKKGL